MWLNGVEMGEQQQQHQWHKDIKLKCEERNFIPYRHNLNQFLFLMCLFMCFAWGTRCGLQMNSFGSLLTLFVSQRVRRKCVSVRRICAADFRFDRRSFSLLFFFFWNFTTRIVWCWWWCCCCECDNETHTEIDMLGNFEKFPNIRSIHFNFFHLRFTNLEYYFICLTLFCCFCCCCCHSIVFLSLLRPHIRDRAYKLSIWWMRSIGCYFKIVVVVFLFVVVTVLVCSEAADRDAGQI